METQDYEEIRLLDASGKSIISRERMAEIEGWFEKTGAWLDRLRPIEPALERFRNGGTYAAIVYDGPADEVVFVNHDGSRFARTPEQLTRLLIVS